MLLIKVLLIKKACISLYLLKVLSHIVIFHLTTATGIGLISYEASANTSREFAVCKTSADVSSEFAISTGTERVFSCFCLYARPLKHLKRSFFTKIKDFLVDF